MNLANIQGKLSRVEMKKIMAGSGKSCADACTQDAECNGDNGCPSCKAILNYPGTYCLPANL